MLFLTNVNDSWAGTTNASCIWSLFTMGANYSVSLFSFFDGVLTAAGSGPMGLLLILRDGLCSNFGKTCIVTCVAAGSLYWLCSTDEKIVCPCTQVILITGCDTGLGFSFAQHACQLGFIVIAGFLDLQSEGCLQLQSICGEGLIPIRLDVTNDENLTNVDEFLQNFFKENTAAKFHALINNAGVMAFGEFEWLTDRIIKEHLNINVLGPMRLTRICLPLLRVHRGRVITIGSHCASVCLPGLAVYGATKAALHAWCDGLRLEVAKYGVKVIKFIPGSFVIQTNIMSRLPRDRLEIERNLTSEQRSYYGTYLDRYYKFLRTIPVPNKVFKIQNPGLYKKFEAALTHKYPKAVYKHEPFHYKLNHLLFKITPTWLRDYLVLRFVNMPTWSQKPEVLVPLNLDI